MSIQLIHAEGELACLYCSTTMVAFGPVFVGTDAVDFAAWWEQREGEVPSIVRGRTDITDMFREWQALPQCTHCEKRVDSVTPFRYEFFVRKGRKAVSVERLCEPCLEEFKENEPGGEVLDDDTKESAA